MENETSTLEYTFNVVYGSEQKLKVTVNYREEESITTNINLDIPLPDIPQGYTIIPNDPNNFVATALQRINVKNSVLYEALRTGRSTTIVLEPTLPPIPGTTGVLMGGAEAMILDASYSLFIDPSKIITESSGRYAGCPTSAPLYIKIANEIRDDLIEYLSDESPISHPIISRIAETYPEIAAEVDEWIRNDDESKESVLIQYFDEKKLSYLPSDDEVEAILSVEPIGTIRLNVEGLTDLSKYAKRPSSTSSPLGSGSTMSFESFNWSEYERAYPSMAKEVRQKQYTRILAHEMQHINFKLTDIRTAYIWQIMDEHISYDSCYPARRNENTNYCSQAGGHEYQNPDGLSTCEEEEDYPIPQAYY